MGGAIVHEWLAPNGGSENVVEAALMTFPGSSLFCLWNDAPERFGPFEPHESWLARTPLRKNKAASLPLMPSVWARTDIGHPDFVLISSHAFAHHVDWRNHAGVSRFVYVHTPARYVWAPELDGRGENGLARLVGRFLKTTDRKVAQGQDAQFAANSEFIRTRIHEAWDVDAHVIYPPVEVEALQSVADWRTRLSFEELRFVESLPDVFILGASRLVAYKRLDLVIAAGEAAGLPVVIAGTGPELAALRVQAENASIPVRFAGRVSDAALRALYQLASVFVFPPVEDFGIMPVEALALGTPVVVNSVGGAIEALPQKLRHFALTSFSRDALKVAVEGAMDVETKLVVQGVDAFGASRFQSQLREWVSPRDTEE